MIDVGIYTSCIDHHGYGIFVSISRSLGFFQAKSRAQTAPRCPTRPVSQCQTLEGLVECSQVSRWLVVRLAEWLVTVIGLLAKIVE